MATILGLLTLLIGAAVIAAVAVRCPAVSAPLITGFLARCSVALIDSEVYRLPGQDDAIRYDYFAYYWSRNGVMGTLEHLQTGAALYTWVASVLYAVFERSRLMMQGINVLFGSLMVFYVWRLAALIGENQKLALRAAWLAALFPSLVFFSSIMLREVVVAFPLVFGVYYLTKWHRDRRNIDIAFAVLGLLVSMAFHSGGVAVLLGGAIWICGNWVRSIVRGDYRQLGRSTLALLAAGAVIAAVVSSGFGMGKFNAVTSGELHDLNAQQDVFARGRTAYLDDLRAEQPLDLVWQSPIRLTYFLFAPFPWMITAGSDVVGLIDSLFFLALSWRTWRSRRWLGKHPQALMVLGVFGAMAITFALGVSNYGTALRHRSKMLPMFIAAAIALPIPRRSAERDYRLMPST